jgi:hypothetical protein
MKKTIFVLLLLACFGLSSYSQKGHLCSGLQGGFATEYNAPLYGLEFAYDVSDLLQVSLSGLVNPSVKEKDGFDAERDRRFSLRSTNLDARIFIVNQGLWAMGPSLGAQYLSEKNKQRIDLDYNTFGFNIGWILRISVSENMRATLGWRYTSVQEENVPNYHFFSLSVGYSFKLF